MTIKEVTAVENFIGHLRSELERLFGDGIPGYKVETFLRFDSAIHEAMIKTISEAKP